MGADSLATPATPRTIADRVLRARRATEVSKTKAASELSKRLSSSGKAPAARAGSLDRL